MTDLLRKGWPPSSCLLQSFAQGLILLSQLLDLFVLGHTSIVVTLGSIGNLRTPTE